MATQCAAALHNLELYADLERANHLSKTSVRGTQNEHRTGLGLLICRQVVEAHRGRIWLESEVGQGSTLLCIIACHLK